MAENLKILVGIDPQSGERLHLPLSMTTRHGLITGATGTGKTVTLQILAEAFSQHGVPVFAADVKGDLSGIGTVGSLNSKISERISSLGIEGYENRAFPVILWDLMGSAGHPMRCTISEMGPISSK